MTNHEEIENYTQLDKKYDQPLHNKRRSAWYVWGHHIGRLVVFGPFQDEAEASYYGMSKLPTFEVVELPTIDSQKATNIIRKKSFDRTSDLEQSLKRAKHKI